MRSGDFTIFSSTGVPMRVSSNLPSCLSDRHRGTLEHPSGWHCQWWRGLLQASPRGNLNRRVELYWCKIPVVSKADTCICLSFLQQPFLLSPPFSSLIKISWQALRFSRRLIVVSCPGFGFTQAGKRKGGLFLCPH